jgi:hypothetical protein
MSQPAVTYMQQAFYYVLNLQDRHPYRFSFALSCLIVSIVLFSQPVEQYDESSYNLDNTRIINIDAFSPPKRKAKQEVTTDEGAEIDQDVVPVERAEGSLDDGEAVDLAFYTDVAAPRLLKPLKRLYPQVAKDKNVEALVHVELLIGIDGIVKNVRVISVRLSKEFPSSIKQQISKAFARDTIKMLMGARFTPMVVEGKKVPIKTDTPIQFKLE